MAKKYAMLVKVDGDENNNKFYEIKWNEDDTVTARYGRVGTDGVIEHKGSGEAAFDKVFKAKTSARKGYKQVDIMVSEGGTPTSSTKTSSLVDIAKRDIANNNPTLTNLLTKLSEINRFNLLSATGGQIDIVDGEVKTALGLVTKDSIDKAREKLNDLNDIVNKTKKAKTDQYKTFLNEYLTLVPQKVPRARGWQDIFFTEVTTLDKQYELLDQLVNSIDNAKPIVQTDTTQPQKVFGYTLSLLDDSKTFKEIEKFYKSSMNRTHACSHLSLKKVYVVTNEDKRSIYNTHRDKLGNEQRLWHGTRAHNLLSILKGGLIIPPLNGGYTIAGRMFGNGVYFSDQSTKSLNYAYGYWNSGYGYDNNCFMLLANVAMGKSYTPSGPFNSYNTFPKGYDSCYAIGGKSGVQNNEMIVYNTNQFDLTFLCEFDK
jgi:poly [ADP-ribose] polymerase 2/3/4